MMALLSRLLGGITGSSLLTPGLILGMLVLGHNWWLERDARQQAAGKQQCDANWNIAAAQQGQKVLEEEAQRWKAFFEIERDGNEELQNELKRTKDTYDQALAAASSDPRCLSDGVLDALRKRGSMAGPR